MKTVSFEIAKALNDAGCPQGNTLGKYAAESYYDYDQERELQEGQYSESFMILGIDAPTYIDAWLWLWKTIGIHIDIWSDGGVTHMIIWDKHNRPLLMDDKSYSGPEEVIISGINYLVSNKLIK